MTEFTASFSIVPNAAHVINPSALPGGLEFYNKGLRSLNMFSFQFIEGDKVVEVILSGEGSSDWSDEIPDHIAAAYGQPNAPVESDDYCKNLRFPRFLPARILEVFTGLYFHNIGINEDSWLRIEGKQKPFNGMKHIEDVLSNVTK